MDLPDWVEVTVVLSLKSDVATPRSDSLLLGRRSLPDVEANGPGPENGDIKPHNEIGHVHHCRCPYEDLRSGLR